MQSIRLIFWDTGQGREEWRAYLKSILRIQHAQNDKYYCFKRLSLQKKVVVYSSIAPTFLKKLKSAVN